MNESVLSTLPVSTALLKNNPDESLLLSASARWRDSSQGLQALFAAAPLRIHRPEPSLNERWNAYWDARAPGTQVSRRERAGQLYRSHFEACAQVAFARRTLTAEQLQPLLLILAPPASGLRLNDQPVQTEQLTLVLSDSGTLKLPAAWVISVGDQPPTAQWLYLPGRPVPIQIFNQRSDMEDWLSRQSLVPQGLPDDDLRFEYTAKAQPLTVGLTELLLHPQYANAVVFASPPDLEIPLPDPLLEDEQPLFDSLFADIPWPQRQASLNRQRDALEALLGDELDSDRQQPFKDALKALETAEQAADTAASALLYRSRTLDFSTINREFSALYQAHKDGLLAEAQLQLTLKHLDSDEFSLLKAVLDTPLAADRDAAITAASLTLSMTEPNGGVTSQALNGPFVITRDTPSPHSLLLYWPGLGGGLQRFANRTELEQQLFKIQEQDPILALDLNKIVTDPLSYSLDKQTTHFEEQAAHLRQAPQSADELEKLRKQTLATLQVPVPAARSLAFSHLLEQSRSAKLFSLLPNWLATLSASDRAELKGLVEAYLLAMHRSHAQLAIALPPRDDFTRQHLQARLRKDFSLNGHFAVQLDLPDSVTLQKQLSDGASPGTPQKLVAVPSTSRSKMSLETLAQLNIDNTPSMQLEPLSLRLGFMRLEVTAADETERRALASGITLPWLRKVLPELDLPQAYENLIRDAFMGSASETAFIKEHRRECLIEPWRLMLQLQGTCARLQKQINQNEWQVLNLAITADTAQAWNVAGKRIVILPAYLSAGGKDTPNEGPTTLSGVTFIEEQVSGMTLLYLPDSPDGQFLRRYDSLETARRALFNLCLRSEMVSYLAGRALQGNVRAHASRINQAVLKHFDAMIGVGLPWPKTTSLSAHLLDAHMGRLIEAHRGTSRSNDALYLERYALSGPRAFNYIKMALGMVPFVGAGIALYDAWNSANHAVAALLRGDVGDGLTEIESVLLSLIDAAMDILPGASVGARTAKGARSLTRIRQLSALGKNAGTLHAPSKRRARHAVQRFAGYEYEKPISLTGLEPATYGVYRNVYRHADGDFIVRQGRIFQIEGSSDSRNWRLCGTSQKTYKQPVGLDEAGNWDTWFGVYGVTFEGGGLGGGGVLGHLADGLDPLWPAVIRERLPRWWTDQTLRRHQALTEAADAMAPLIDAQITRTTALMETYNTSPEHLRPALIQALEAACIKDMELGIKHYQTLADLIPMTRGNKMRVLKEIQSNDALLLADRAKQRVVLASQRALSLTDRIDDLLDQLDLLPAEALGERLRILEDVRKLRLENMLEFDAIDAHMRDLNLWYPRITDKPTKTVLSRAFVDLNAKLTEANQLYLKTSHLLEIVKRYDSARDVSWFYLQVRAQTLRTKVDRALFTQHSLPEVSATRAQRNRILQECLDLYGEFRRNMNAWTASYPQHFHLEAVGPLLEGIEKMAERARKAIDQPAPASPAGQHRKKVFTTEDDQLLIGEERWEPTTQKRQYTLTGQRGFEEVWEQGTNGKFRLLNPQEQAAHPAHRDLGALTADARSRLAAQAAYKTRVEAYARQDMLPVDLEHMMLSEAAELGRRALTIEELQPGHALVQQLRDKATELSTTAQVLRIEYSMNSRNPTDGMLDYLMKQNSAQKKIVDIHKRKPMEMLGKRADGRTDYLQEYEVRDLTQTPPKVMWYAHFHYSKAAPAFGEFEKAHLKLPEYRFLTHANNANLPYADIGKKSAALEHFDQA
ncbi:dermonecrotic toxin domain-containing protein [Pseudomonas lini]|uniref:dermonecrotic toxin domain-containing protein n=1 Tax=Pseudomonas lini TaxID=163011 RepID=UPI00345E1D11